MRRRKVAIFLFEEVEVLDFAGPFEVFSVTGQRDGVGLFEVFTVAENRRQVMARNGLSINPVFEFADCPRPDILVVPGGYGTRQELMKPNVLNWIAETSSQCELVLSVCSGALLLARAGLLDGLRATTHHAALDELKHMATDTRVDGCERIVDNGRVILSAGVAAGMDMSFHVVARLHGQDVAAETASYIEYNWTPIPSQV